MGLNEDESEKSNTYPRNAPTKKRGRDGWWEGERKEIEESMRAARDRSSGSQERRARGWCGGGGNPSFATSERILRMSGGIPVLRRRRGTAPRCN